MTKADLRREMRRRLSTLGAERAEKSRAIMAALAAHPTFASAGTIALFAPLPGEPDIDALGGKGPCTFCYPRVAGDQLEFVRVARSEDLTPAAWHPLVREPPAMATDLVAPADIALILVPGLAFTRAGLRLGRGGGFYDRFLSRLPGSTVKMGTCFEAQIVEALPVEPHDQRVDAIVTEHGTQSTFAA